MTTIETFVSPKQSALAARVVALLLVLLVTYGALGGTTHHHGDGGRLNDIDSNVTTLTGGGSGDENSKSVPKSGECLICQLHQHLFSGLLTTAPQIEPPVVQRTHTSTSDVVALSKTYAPRRGRAPPISLS